MNRSPSWEASSLSASQGITALCGIQSFITMFTRARHWSLSWIRWIQSTTSHLISL